MSENTEWFIAERVRALSKVYLTRRSDLLISETKGDLGFDFAVDLVKGDARTTRRFGVVLRGTRSPVSDAMANVQLKPSMQALSRIGEFPFPVCLFYFTMDDSKGRFTWVAEPVVVDEARPTLVVHKEANCAPLSSSTIEQIVTAVDQWYDCLFAILK